MPHLTVDGREVEVAQGTTVIQAAEKVGVFIPRYCYHPGLSIAGSCRMCMVEIEKMPRPQISCHTLAADGMVVHTGTEPVIKARRHMLEFLLTNHPLDCPVCDQSGECDLQNFYMEYGRYQSRFYEDKIKRQKAHPLGPHVVLDQERCILCSRCVRFTEEISKTHELGILNRGNRSVIDLYLSTTLDNPYSGNVIDICPVGALTEKEFRFKCRVWYLSSRDSICPGCSQGCNITVQFNGTPRTYKAGGRRIQRLKPRFNPEVNQWWMCDEGRFGFEFVDQDRIEFPHLRRSGTLQPCDWSEAIEEVATALRSTVEKFGPHSVGVVASPQMTNEELYLARQLFRNQLGIDQIAFRNPEESPGSEDDFLIRGDKNPNSRGAELLGFNGDLEALLKSAEAGKIKILYVFRHDLKGRLDPLLAHSGYVIFQGTNWSSTASAASAVLPGATFVEKQGTFTNWQGRIQKFEPAVEPVEESREDVEILLQLGEALGIALEWETPEEIFQAWRGKDYSAIPPEGEVLLETSG